MKNYMRGMLTLWTILTTLWMFISMDVIKELAKPSKRPITYRSYYDIQNK